jgi:hypothetical protein
MRDRGIWSLNKM